jgi:hypothetical protein
MFRKAGLTAGTFEREESKNADHWGGGGVVPWLGLPSNFRSEIISRKRLEMVFVISPKKWSFCGIPCLVIAYSEVRNGTKLAELLVSLGLPIPRFGAKRNSTKKMCFFFKVNHVFFFVLERFGMSFQRFFLMVRKENPSVFLFCEMVRNGILSIFIFRRRIRNEITKFREFFSSRKCRSGHTKQKTNTEDNVYSCTSKKAACWMCELIVF